MNDGEVVIIMVLEFSIMGGYIEIPKKVFIQEMLRKESRLRQLLNWKSSKDFTSRHPMVGEPGVGDIITINFSNYSNVSIGESPKEILGELKARYKARIKGRVTCRATYSTFGQIFNFDIDLNSNDDNIEYIQY